MKKLIESYKSEIDLASQGLELWKKDTLQYSICCQRKTTYERVVSDLEESLKNHVVLDNVVKSCDIDSLVERVKDVNELILPNGATGAVWLSDVIEIIEKY